MNEKSAEKRRTSQPKQQHPPGFSPGLSEKKTWRAFASYILGMHYYPENMSDHILRLLRFFERDQAELRQASTADVSDTALELLAQQERAKFPDVDLLISAGRKFRLTGHHSIDAVVEPWLIEQPTSRRFDVASSFLSGYWGSNLPIRETIAEQIAKQLPFCESDPNALPSMLVALSQVSRTAASEETKLLVRKVLVAYRNRAVELKLQRGTVQLIDEALG